MGCSRCLLLCLAWIFIIGFCFFFFKQKTAYEMRISDWSSDVCSSDLLEADRATVLIYIFVHSGALLRVIAPLLPFDYMAVIAVAGGLWAAAFLVFLLVYVPMAVRPAPGVRAACPPQSSSPFPRTPQTTQSEERRVGKKCGRRMRH